MHEEMTYSIAEHSHRLAAWAASRSASIKSFPLEVADGRAILEASGFDPEFNVDRLPAADDQSIDVAHAVWRKKVIAEAKKQGLGFTHGIAARLINVYLKVRFVCGGFEADERVERLHPPVDRELLKGLGQKNVGGLKKDWNALEAKGWAAFDSAAYEGAIQKIRRSLEGRPLWEIEEFWPGHQTAATVEKGAPAKNKSKK